MGHRPRIAIIVGSTRDSRFGEKPAQWIRTLAAKRGGWEAELVDLRDFDLPLFNEKASNLWAPSEDPRVVAWQEKLAGFDGFIFVTPEYNRSIPGALKNALDQAYREWVRKPAAVVGYGPLGAARAAEHLRNIAVELQMVPIRFGVHIQGADFYKVSPMGENAEMASIDATVMPSVKAMLDDLEWWVAATREARARTLAKAA